MSFEIHPEGHATIGGVPFCAGPAVRVFHDYRPPPPGVCPSCGESGTAIRGVQLDLANGLELSIMWGTGNYCDARYDASTFISDTAEIALFDADGDIIGDVAGWIGAADVLALIPLIAAANPQRLLDTPEFHPLALAPAH